MALQYRKGICTCHKKERLIVKRMPSGNFCKEGNDNRLNKLKEESQPVGQPEAPTQVYRIPSRKKKEKDDITQPMIFKAIWYTRPRVSFVSGTPLGKEARSVFFAHVIRKGIYPKFEVYERGIVLLTKKEHDLWDEAKHDDKRKAELVAIHPGFQKLIDLEAELLQKYNQVDKDWVLRHSRAYIALAQVKIKKDEYSNDWE